MSNQVKDMTWREVQERLREFPVVIVPIGSTEQHGYFNFHFLKVCRKFPQTFYTL